MVRAVEYSNGNGATAVGAVKADRHSSILAFRVEASNSEVLRVSYSDDQHG
jgi:hypothetical protein